MRTLKAFAAVAAFVASSALAPVSLAQDMQLLCENGQEAELHCTYTRDGNGNIVVHSCAWVCV